MVKEIRKAGGVERRLLRRTVTKNYYLACITPPLIDSSSVLAQLPSTHSFAIIVRFLLLNKDTRVLVIHVLVITSHRVEE